VPMFADQFIGSPLILLSLNDSDWKIIHKS
jgi:hypothetical protein